MIRTLILTVFLIIITGSIKSQVHQNILYNGSFEQNYTGDLVDATNHLNPYGFSTGQCPTASGSSYTYADMQVYWGYVYGWDVPNKRGVCSGAGKGPGSADVYPTPARTGLLGESSSGREYTVNSFRAPGIKTNQIYYIEIYNKVSSTGWDQRGLRFYDYKPKHCLNTRIKDDGPPQLRATNAKDGTWGKTQRYFSPNQDYTWLALGAFDGPGGVQAGSFDDLRIFPLGNDYCADDDWMFQNTDLYTDIFQATDEIYAGSNVMSYYYAHPGPVTIKANNNVIFKAGTRVVMDAGFSTDDDSYFETVIEPCSGSALPPCFFTPPNPVVHEACNGNPVEIGFGSGQTGLQYSWSPSAYLSATDIPNPIFTPPPGIGSMTYDVTITTLCGGFYNPFYQGTSITVPVTVIYADNPVPPTLTVSNEVYGEHSVSFDAQVGTTCHWINVSLPNSGYNHTFYNGIDFTCCTLNFNHIFDNCDMSSVCDDEPIIITVKNVCEPVPLTHNLLWDKPSGTLTVGPWPNVITPNGDGVNDIFCFDVQHADRYTMIVYNRWGLPVFTKYNQCVGSDPLCVFEGKNNGEIPLVDGTYYYIMEFEDCNGDVSSGQQWFSLTSTKSQEDNSLPKDPKNPVDEASLMVNIYPNPTNGQVTVQTTSGVSRIEIIDITGKVLVSRENCRTTEEFDLSSYAAGTYHVSIRLDAGDIINELILKH